MTNPLDTVKEALEKIKQSAGAKMDFGSNDTSHQTCYIQSTKALAALKEHKERERRETFAREELAKSYQSLKEKYLECMNQRDKRRG